MGRFRRIDALVLLVSTLILSLLLCSDVAQAGKGIEVVEPVFPPWPKDAMVALNDAACDGNQNGAIFGGSGDTYIMKSSIFTNGCLRGNGDQYMVAVRNGAVRYVGGQSGPMNFQPAPIQASTPITETVDLVNIIQAECDKLPVYPRIRSTRLYDQTIIYPGNYTGDQLPDGEWKMMPGLYCVTGDMNFTANDHVVAENVTIFLHGGSIYVNGNAELLFSAPRQEVGPLNIFTHLLFYLTEGDLIWNASSQQSAAGRIYAPLGRIVVNGSSAERITLHTQLIGWNVEITEIGTIEFFPDFLDYFSPD